MSVLKNLLVNHLWKDFCKYPMSCCPSSCRRLISNKSQPSDEAFQKSPLKRLLDDAASVNDTSQDPENVWATTPYPENLRQQMEQESGVNPEDMSVILFPGQGTQYMGMGKDLVKFPKAKDLFDLANEVIGVNLLEITKPQDLTKYAQELIVVTSLAAVEKLQEERPSALISCVATAGFSLGEITALIFAGAIPLEHGLKLVSLRSAAMEAASKERPGGMLTIIYTPEANIKKVCSMAVQHCHEKEIDDAFCSVANYLYPSCKVIAGCEEALKFIEKNAKSLGIRKTRRVNVGGAFHSEAVAAAVGPFKEALNLCQVDDPQMRVMSGVTGKHYKNAKHIRSLLPKQIVQPVRWEQMLHNLYARPQDTKFPRTYEVGPGNTLRSILRQVNAKAWDNSISVPA